MLTLKVNQMKCNEMSATIFGKVSLSLAWPEEIHIPKDIFSVGSYLLIKLTSYRLMYSIYNLVCVCLQTVRLLWFDIMKINVSYIAETALYQC